MLGLIQNEGNGRWWPLSGAGPAGFERAGRLPKNVNWNSERLRSAAGERGGSAAAPCGKALPFPDSYF